MLGVAVSSLPQRPAAEVDPDALTLVKVGSKEGASSTNAVANAAPNTPTSPENRTLLGLPLGAVAPATRPQPAENQRTLLGVVAASLPPSSNSVGVTAPSPADGTLLGIARPGIAPVHNNAEAAERPQKQANGARVMPHELGATFYEDEVPSSRALDKRPSDKPASERPASGRDKLARRRIVLPPVRHRDDPARAKARNASNKRRAMPVIITAGALIIFALLFAIFWRSAPPLSARVRATADGRDALEITCPNCPDGTRVLVGVPSANQSAVASGHSALVPLVAPLVLGENRIKVGLDRPSGGRDESVGVTVQVSYRLRPDLGGLGADKPSVSVLVEAVSGTLIDIEGKPVSLKDGPAAYTIDVSKECTGGSDETATLRRRLPYVVKTVDGAREEGVVDIAVGVVPLRIDAPGPRVVIEGETFVLAGHTMKGAEVFAAGRPIQVAADGSFAQRMSVSSVGSTNIEVRAKALGMAPRLVPIAVRRVERLEAVAREIMAQKPMNYGAMVSAGEGDLGRDVVVSGEIMETRTQNHQTIVLLDVPALKEGCPNPKDPCRVRLVHGFPNTAKVGDKVTAYGQLGKAFVSGAETVPEVLVAFMLSGNR